MLEVTKMKRYLRFGEIPKNEKSINFLKISLNKRDDVHYYLSEGMVEEAYSIVPEEALEPGVSVFELDENGNPILSTLNHVRALSIRIDGKDDCTAYIVMGNEVGHGNDGEPLITNIKVLEKVDVDKNGMLKLAVEEMRKHFQSCEPYERNNANNRRMYDNTKEWKANTVTGERVDWWNFYSNKWKKWEHVERKEYQLGDWTFWDPIDDGFCKE